MDSHRRSIVKALSWRVIAVAITTFVAWIVTRKLHFAATIGLIDTAIKLGAYYFHERTWNRISFGRPRPMEYQI